MADVQERGFWKDYQEAYEEMIQHTATKHAPWYVIPAHNKRFTRLAVGSPLIATLGERHARTALGQVQLNNFLARAAAGVFHRNIHANRLSPRSRRWSHMQIGIRESRVAQSGSKLELRRGHCFPFSPILSGKHFVVVSE